MPSRSIQPNWDIVIAGGGPAGFFAAIRCAELDPRLRVLVIERASQTLGKVLISGGGHGGMVRIARRTAENRV